MSTAATRPTDLTISLPPAERALYLALELSSRDWRLAMSCGPGQPARRRAVRAGDLPALDREIARAKDRLGLPPPAPVVSCYEAGRDGFWLHRALGARGITNSVVDSASIEVNRRARRAKTDRLDAERLLGLLLRYAQVGERTVWRVVHVPPEAVEDARHLHRELVERKRERTRLSNQVRSLLTTQGLRAGALGRLAATLGRLRRWDGSAVPAGVRARLERAVRRWERVHEEVRELERLVHRQVHPAARSVAPAVATAQRLAQLRAIGEQSAWVLSHELYGWRQFRSGREVSGLSGLTPTPYNSGTSARDQGISRAGNRWVRRLAVELGWNWLRWQPTSELAQWYQRRFAAGGPRLRRIGIVAVARKLLVALWRYVETGVVPAGARLKPGVS
jgi:transposase